DSLSRVVVQVLRQVVMAGLIEAPDGRLGEGCNAKDGAADDVGGDAGQQNPQPKLPRSALDENDAQRDGADRAENGSADTEDQVAEEEFVGGDVGRPASEVGLWRRLMRDGAGEQRGGENRNRP